MGVTGLWDLLAPAGRRVNPDTLEGRIMAVDSSIWIVQFIKAMRDASGNMVRAAHLVGFFKRICKLLYFGIRPVFVFDGPPPNLKLRTLLQRHAARDEHEIAMKRAAEKLLLNRLKRKVMAKAVSKRSSLPSPTNANDAQRRPPPELGGGSSFVAGSVCARPPELGSGETHTTESSSTCGHAPEGVQELPMERAGSTISWLAYSPAEGDESTGRAPDNHKRGGSSQEAEEPELAADEDALVNATQRAAQRIAYYNNIPHEFMGFLACRRRLDDIRIETTGLSNLLAMPQSAKTALEGERQPHPQSGKVFRESEDFKEYRFVGDDGEERYVQLPLDSEIDPAVFKHLPPKMQYSILTQLREAWFNHARLLAVQAKDDAAAFSNVQVESFMRHVHTSKEIARVQKLMADQVHSSIVSADTDEANVDLEGVTSTGAIGPLTADRGEVLQAPPQSLLELPASGIAPSVLPTQQVRRPKRQKRTTASVESRAPPPFGTLKGLEAVAAARARKSPAEGSRAVLKANPLEAWEAIRDALAPEDERKDAPLAMMKQFEAAAFYDDDDVDDDVAVQRHPAAALLSVDFFLPRRKDDVFSPPSEGDDGRPPDVARLPLNAPANHPEGGSPLEPISEDLPQPTVGESRQATPKPRKRVHLARKAAATAVLAPSLEMASPAVKASPVQFDEDTQGPGGVDGDEWGEWVGAAAPPPPPSLTSGTVKGVEPRAEDHSEAHAESRSEARAESRSKAHAESRSEVCVATGSATAASLPHFRAVAAEGVEESMPEVDRPFLEVDPSSLLEVGEAAPAAEAILTGLSFFEREAEQRIAASFPAEMDEAAGASDRRAEGRSASYDVDSMINQLDQEATRLEAQLQTSKRDAEIVTPEMQDEVRELLHLFGIPFVDAPAEAEAQCAAWTRLKLCDGVITDDSDAVLFGATEVYRRFFSSTHSVEMHCLEAIQSRIGLTREMLILVAMLLGCDYTVGVRGIGIVNAVEAVKVFDTLDSLRELREWACDQSRVRGSGVHAEDDPLKRLYKETHKRYRYQWSFPPHFPDAEVWDAFVSPRVDESLETFTWGRIKADELISFMQQRTGLAHDAIMETLRPTFARLALRPAAALTRQTRISEFFSRALTDAESMGQIRSKRLANAVELLKKDGDGRRTRGTRRAKNTTRRTALRRRKAAGPELAGAEVDESLKKRSRTT